jgi:valyl-tRNA synthetase
MFGFGKGSIQFEAPPEKASLDDAELENRKLVSAIYETVQAGRNLRAEAGIASNKRAKFLLRTDIGESDVPLETVARLLYAEDLGLSHDKITAASVPMAVTRLGEIFLVVDETDKAAERVRLDKEIVRIEQELRTVESKLSSKSFVDRAPAAVVEEHRQREKNFAEQLKKLKEARNSLGL